MAVVWLWKAQYISEPYVRKNSGILYVIFMSIFLVLFSGLRGLTGTDTITYQLFYETNFYPLSMEKLYIKMSQFFYQNGSSFTLFQIVTALLTILPIVIQYYKKSENIYFTLLLFYLFSFYLFSFNVSRQTLAAAILFFGYMNLKRQSLMSKIIFFLTILVSFEIHKSSLYMVFGLLGAYVISKLILKKKSYLIFSGIVFIVLAVVFYKTNFVFNKLTSFSGSFSTYDGYLTAGTAGGVLTYKSLITFITAVLSSLLILMYSKFSSSYQNAKLFAPFLLYTLLEILQVNWISDRLIIFMLPMIPLFFTHMVYSRDDKSITNNDRYMLSSIIFILGIMSFGRIVIQNFGQILPYQG